MRSPFSLETLCLERDSAVPMYLQLASSLESAIHGGALAAGQSLPSETTLCRELRISRITVRQAADVLIAKGLVERRQGKGTFVAHHLIRQDAQSMSRLLDTLFAQERAPASEVLAFGPGDCPPDVASAFGDLAGEKLVRLDRLYILDGEPVGLGLGWLMPEARVISPAQVEANSSRRLIEDFLGHRLGRTEVVVRAAAAGRTIARRLRIGERAPVLVLVRRRLLTDGRTADYTRFYMRSDSFEFSFDDLTALENHSALKVFAA